MSLNCKCGNKFDQLQVGGKFADIEVLRCKTCAAVMINEYSRGDVNNRLLFTQYFPTDKTEILRDEYKNRRR